MNAMNRADGFRQSPGTARTLRQPDDTSSLLRFGVRSRQSSPTPEPGLPEATSPRHISDVFGWSTSESEPMEWESPIITPKFPQPQLNQTDFSVWRILAHQGQALRAAIVRATRDEPNAYVFNALIHRLLSVNESHAARQIEAVERKPGAIAPETVIPTEPVALSNAALAASQGNSIGFQLLAQAGQHISPHEVVSILAGLIMGNHTQMAQQLLKMPEVDVNQRNMVGISPLVLAAQTNRLDMAELLLAHPHINPNQGTTHTGVTALMLAAGKGNLPIVRQLLAHPRTQAYAENHVGETALMYASYYGKNEALQTLVDFALPININHRRVTDGSTALMLAVVGRQSHTVTALLQHLSTDPNVQNVFGATALHVAIAERESKAARALLKHTATQVNTPDWQGATPLMLAVLEQAHRLVHDLLAHPLIDVNLSDNQGDTALIMAVRSGDERLVKALLQQPGIALHVRNTSGQTAISIAEEADNTAILRLLRLSQEAQRARKRSWVLGDARNAWWEP